MLKHVVFGTLTTINETMFAANSDSFVRINSFWIANTSSSNDNLYLHHVPSGQSASASNALFYGTVFRPNSSTVVDPAGIAMEPGDRIVVKATNAGRLVVHAYMDVLS